MFLAFSSVFIVDPETQKIGQSEQHIIIEQQLLQQRNENFSKSFSWTEISWQISYQMIVMFVNLTT